MNGGLHIKQESSLQDHHMSRENSEQMHHVIKREIHSEYDDIDESHGDGMAEDLTVSVEHNETNVMDA